MLTQSHTQPQVGLRGVTHSLSCTRTCVRMCVWEGGAGGNYACARAQNKGETEKERERERERKRESLCVCVCVLVCVCACVCACVCQWIRHALWLERWRIRESVLVLSISIQTRSELMRAGPGDAAMQRVFLYSGKLDLNVSKICLESRSVINKPPYKWHH